MSIESCPVNPIGGGGDDGSSGGGVSPPLNLWLEWPVRILSTYYNNETMT